MSSDLEKKELGSREGRTIKTEGIMYVQRECMVCVWIVKWFRMGGAEGIRKGYGRGEGEKVGRAGACDTLMPCNVFGLCPEDPCNSDD